MGDSLRDHLEKVMREDGSFRNPPPAETPAQLDAALPSIASPGRPLLNVAQRACLVVGVLLLGVLAVWVPWKKVEHREASAQVVGIHIEEPIGYAFVFSPPKATDLSVEVNLPLMLTPIAAVVAGTVAGLLMTAKR